MCALVTLPSSLMSRFSWICISVSLSILSTCGLGAIAAERGVRECGGGGQEAECLCGVCDSHARRVMSARTMEPTPINCRLRN